MMFDQQGNLEDLPPHFHLIEWEPEANGITIFAGPRCYAIAGDLPGDVYEPSH